MKIKMELLSDVIFGNGVSVPGGEDISVLCDKQGFPYYKGGTLKGIFREELCRYAEWNEWSKEKTQNILKHLIGIGGESEPDQNKLIFSDFTLSEYVKMCVRKEIGTDDPQEILDIFTNTRTFTSIDENGMVKKGSLRSGRCVDKGLVFWGEIDCAKEDAEMVQEVLTLIKWIGSMRNRGFGKVRFTVL